MSLRPLTFEAANAATMRELVEAGVIVGEPGRWTWVDGYRGEVSVEFADIARCWRSLLRRLRSHDDLYRRPPHLDEV